MVLLLNIFSLEEYRLVNNDWLNDRECQDISFSACIALMYLILTPIQIVNAWFVLYLWFSQLMLHNLCKLISKYWYTCLMGFSRNWETLSEGLLMTCLIWKIKWKHYGQDHFCLIFVNPQHLIDYKFILLNNLWLWLFLMIVNVWNLFCT